MSPAAKKEAPGTNPAPTETPAPAAETPDEKPTEKPAGKSTEPAVEETAEPAPKPAAKSKAAKPKAAKKADPEPELVYESSVTPAHPELLVEDPQRPGEPIYDAHALFGSGEPQDGLTDELRERLHAAQHPDETPVSVETEGGVDPATGEAP